MYSLASNPAKRATVGSPPARPPSLPAQTKLALGGLKLPYLVLRSASFVGVL